MSREDPQLKLRLPEGLRDRIKAKAESTGRSMNAEIVKVLEKEFPEPWDLGVRVKYLLDLFTALRKVRGDVGAIDGLTNVMLETVEGLASGRVPDLDEESRRRVKESLDEWHEQVAQDEHERAHWYDDEGPAV